MTIHFNDRAQCGEPTDFAEPIDDAEELTMAHSYPRIRQIMPAPGWRSLWVWRDDKGEPEVFAEALVGWAVVARQDPDTGTDFDEVEALVLSDGATAVDLVSEERAAGNSSFVCLLQPAESIETRREYALETLHRREATQERLLRARGEGQR